MKNLLPIVVLTLVVGAISVESQAKGAKKERPKWLSEETTVFVIGNPSVDEIVVKQEAIDLFRRSQPAEYQGVGMPRFLITDKSARATFAIGGYVNFRLAYDMGGIMEGTTDFVPYDLPMMTNPLNAERLLMSANTSRLYFRTVIATGAGPLEAYIETDFRGAGNTLRLRQAYVKFFGFKVGQAVTTFSDPNGAFNTIDFEGPNGYTYGRNLIIQYSHKWDNGVGMGVAMEYPLVRATYGVGSSAVHQRVPDMPAYVEYSWGKYGSHIRASTILRNMFYANNIENSTKDQIGWGVQLSGSWGMCSALTLYGQVLYGQGITPYIQDLQGTPYDMVPNGRVAGGELATPMMGWLAGAQFNITKRLPLTVGYSQVTMFDSANSMQPTDYHIGQYVVANLFYKISRTWKVGVEYLYGTRINFNGNFASSHRIQTAVQLNF